MTTTGAIVALGMLAGAVAIYKIFVSKSGSVKIFTFEFKWGS